MKFIRRIALFFIFLIPAISFVNAGFFDAFIDGGSPDIRYCDGADECGLDQGIQVVKGGLDNIVTDRSLSDYIQDVVIYLLGFIALIGVIYIMYAGFMILIGNGDEEKVKKSKQTILYVALGIGLIFLAWPIVLFIFDVIGA